MCKAVFFGGVFFAECTLLPFAAPDHFCLKGKKHFCPWKRNKLDMKWSLLYSGSYLKAQQCRGKKKILKEVENNLICHFLTYSLYVSLEGKTVILNFVISIVVWLHPGHTLSHAWICLPPPVSLSLPLSPSPSLFLSPQASVNTLSTSTSLHRPATPTVEAKLGPAAAPPPEIASLGGRLRPEHDEGGAQLEELRNQMKELALTVELLRAQQM